jgi:hypothetical protein
MLPITKKLTPTPFLLYVQPQSVPQGRALLHTQAYIAPAQPQYPQQFVYTQPGIVYSDPAAAYSNFYARIPAYIQDNSLHGLSNQYQEQSVLLNQYQDQQQLYVTPTIGQETPKEILQEQVGQDLPAQAYVKVCIAKQIKN